MTCVRSYVLEDFVVILCTVGTQQDCRSFLFLLLDRKLLGTLILRQRYDTYVTYVVRS